MITLQSNLRAVIEELEGVAGGMDAAIQREFEPGAWLPVARESARMALLPRAGAPEKAALVEPFVRAVTTAAFPEGMVWQIDAVGQDLAAAVLEEFQGGPGDLFATGAREQITRDVVARWVREEKQWTNVDRNLDGSIKTPDEVTDHIYTLLTSRDAPAQRAARGLLFGRTGESGLSILEFASVLHDTNVLGLGPAEALDWLLAILDAWTEALLERMPPQMVRAVEGLFSNRKT